jgi:hypothetical protein
MRLYFPRLKKKICLTSIYNLKALSSFYGVKEIVQFLVEKKAHINLVDTLTNRLTIFLTEFKVNYR